MKVTLLAHTQLEENFKNSLLDSKSAHVFWNFYDEGNFEAPSDGQVVSLAAIRQCYSHKTALEVLETESEKYFGDKGREGKRLMNHIVKSGHTSTLEHITFTFAVEGVSRALLAQLTRHRFFSFSVQSQRYNKFSSDSRSGGFDYVTPKTILDNEKVKNVNDYDLKARDIFGNFMEFSQNIYDALIDLGIPQEDARSVLPNAAACNLVMTGNLRSLLDFYQKRKPGNGAQHEIAQFAESLKDRVIEVEPWTEEYFTLTSSK